MSIAEKLQTVAANEQRVYQAGYDKGYEDGSAEGGGYDEGYTEGVEQGKQEEYDRFWDTYQDYGNRTDYDYAFYYGWTQENFKPKYKMVPRTMTNGFRYMNIPDFAASVELDTSQCINMDAAFGGSGFEHIGVIDLSSCTYGCHNVFGGATNLHTVDKIIYHEGVTRGELFYRCEKLVNLTIEGTIACNFAIKDSPALSAQSVQSIINALSSSTSGLTATFSKTAVEFAFNENLFDISKLEDTSMIVKKDGQIYVTGYSCIAKQTLGELCPSLKAGDTAKLRMDTTGLPYLYTTSLWTAGSTRVITENDLNAKLAFYGKSDSTAAVISDIAIVTLDAENAEWLNLVATKPNWTIALA